MPRPKCSICEHPKIEQINAAVLAGSSLPDICIIAGKKVARATLARHKEHLLRDVETRVHIDAMVPTQALPDLTSPTLDASGAKLVALLKLAQAADAAGKIAQESQSIRAFAVQGDLLSRFLTHSANIDWSAQDGDG